MFTGSHGRWSELPVGSGDEAESNESYMAADGSYITLQVLTLEHYQSAFVLLSGGCFVALIFYVGEVLVFRIQDKNGQTMTNQIKAGNPRFMTNA